MAEPKYLGKFDYSDLEGYSKAINALEDTAAELRFAMGGAFPDTSKDEPQIETLYTILHNLNDETTVLMEQILSLITKAKKRNG